MAEIFICFQAILGKIVTIFLLEISWILRGKTVVQYTPNYDKQNQGYCRLLLLVKKFVHYQFEPTNQD